MVSIQYFLFVIGLGLSGQSGATSKGYDAPAQVILKDGMPCFFAAMTDVDKPSQYKSLEVRINRGEKVWHIYDDRGFASLPSSAEQCIKYGENWPTGTILRESMPLEYGVPYRADIGTKYLYRVAFCVKRSTRGELSLTRWAAGGNSCTDEPLNETGTYSVWQRMFGK